MILLYIILIIPFICFGQLTPCEEAVANATGSIGEFIPQCEEDGSYSAIQCWFSTGYCLCVDEDGIEIPGTSLAAWEGTPYCDQPIDSLNVLFLGNSYTAFNNLPNIVSNIANSMGDFLYTGSNTIGGATLQTHIEINNSNLWTLSANEVASNIAVVLQEHTSDFSLSVKEIIALGRIPHRSTFFKNSEKDNRIIQNVLRRFSLNEISDQKLSTLSGGEYQRVMIARAFAQEPRLLILDEPTNHLDIRHQLEDIKLIKGLSLSIIVTVHDLNVAASVCDYILLLKKGRSLGFGKPEDILTEHKISSAFNVKTQNEILYPSNCKQITFHI